MARSIALNTVVYNEVHRIVGLLAHAAGYCDELVVVDQGSNDGTPELAKELGATVIHDHPHGYCEPSRPLAAQNTLADWIMYLDADEVVAPKHLASLLALDGFDVARLCIGTYIDGKRADHQHPDGRVHGVYHPRFFRRGFVTYGTGMHTRIEPVPEARVWESPGMDPWVLNTKATWEQELDHARYTA